MLTGSCLCRRVTYEVDGNLGPLTFCHCESCRKAGRGPYVAAAPARRKYFRLLTGADVITEYESSPGKYRGFCRVCGSPLWSRRDDAPDIVRLRLGAVDGDPGRRPAAHVFVAEQAPWFTITDDLPRSDGNGDDRVS
jgi:hypothetical protein